MSRQPHPPGTPPPNRGGFRQGTVSGFPPTDPAGTYPAGSGHYGNVNGGKTQDAGGASGFGVKGNTTTNNNTGTFEDTIDGEPRPPHVPSRSDLEKQMVQLMTATLGAHTVEAWADLRDVLLRIPEGFFGDAGTPPLVARFAQDCYHAVRITPELKGKGLRIMDALRVAFPDVVEEITAKNRAVKRRPGVDSSALEAAERAARGEGPTEAERAARRSRVAERAFAPSKVLPLLDLHKIQEEREMIRGHGPSARRAKSGKGKGKGKAVSVMSVAAEAGAGRAMRRAAASTGPSVFETSRGANNHTVAGAVADASIFSFDTADVEPYDIGTVNLSPPTSPRRAVTARGRSRGGHGHGGQGYADQHHHDQHQYHQRPVTAAAPIGVRREGAAAAADGYTPTAPPRPRSVRARSARELSTAVPEHALPGAARAAAGAAAAVLTGGGGAGDGGATGVLRRTLTDGRGGYDGDDRLAAAEAAAAAMEEHAAGVTDWGDTRDPAVQLDLKTGDDAVAYFVANRSLDPIKFVYLNRARTGDSYRPYDLDVVPREHAEPEHFTMSASGVVHVRPGGTDGPSEFLSLEEWMRQSTLFNMLSSIKYFKHFLALKYFRVWRARVRHIIYCRKRELVSERLFLARPTFLPTLVDLNAQCVAMRTIPLMTVSQDAYNREEFSEMQAQTRQAAARGFEQAMDRVQDAVEKLCEEVIRRARALEDPDVEADAELQRRLLEGASRSKAGQEKNRLRELRKATREAQMLAQFIRLADFIAIENMMGMVFETTQRFLSVLQNPLAKNGLFQTMVGFGAEPGEMTFAPSRPDISQLLRQTVDGMITTVHSVPRVMHMRSLKNFFIVNQNASVPDGLNLQRAIRADDPFREDCEAMEEVCTADFEKAHEVAEIFEEFREIHDFGQTWDFDAYQAADHDLARMTADMHQLREWTKRVEQRIKMFVPAGILNVDAKLMKAHLLPVVTGSLDQLREHLTRLARDTCNALRQQLSSHIRALGEKPRHLRDFAEYIGTLKTLDEDAPRVKAQLALLDGMYGVLDEYEVQREYVDQARYEEVRNMVVSFGEARDNARGKIQAKLSPMTQQTEKRLRQLEEELAAIIQDLSSGIFVESRTDPKTAVARLDDIGKNLDLAAEHASTYGSYLTLFGNPRDEIPLLGQAKSLFATRSELWGSLDKWCEDVATWKASLFEDLDVEAVEAEVYRVYKVALRLDKRLKGADEAAKHFRTLVEEFKVFAPLLVELGNKALTQRHWEQIFRGLNQAWYPGRKFTLAALINMGIAEHRSMIAEVSGVASGEYSLVLMLKKITETWEGMELDVIPHKRAKNVYILSSLEDITATLEDNQVTLQSMFASRWVVGIREEVEVWDKKLSLLSEVLDEWVQCQRSWMYLEVIFSQPDIQRQLPMEHTKFSGVDKRWKEFMRVTYGEPKVLNAVSDEVLEQLVENNKQLDSVQKSLEDYLETKRVAFPRFYFLSNDELLEILSQTTDPLAVQPHLGKCFENMRSLTFVETESGDYNATEMVSSEGEKVSFPRSVAAKGLVEHWLGRVEQSMRSSLSSQMAKCVAGVRKMPHAEWMFAFPAQCVIAVEQMMWAQGVEEALVSAQTSLSLDPSLTSGPAMRKARAAAAVDALKRFQAKWKTQLDSLVNLVRGHLEPLQRSIVGVLIVIDVHARDVVDRMIKEECSSVHDFAWTKQLRYYWDADQDLAIVRQTNTQQTYGYEYLGSTPRLVITPLTDRCYLTLTTALHYNLGGSPAGPAGTGKTETVKDLAKALARQCVVFNCSEGLDYQMMGRFFSGLAQCGAWACFDEFNRIDIEVLSVIAQQLLTILSAVQEGLDRFVFEGRDIELNAHCGFFITMNPGYAGRTELPDNLKALFRPVAMMIPDYAMIAEIMLYSEGFLGAHGLARKMADLYRLASEQLSQQDHYDFGMRAVKSVLVMAGALKRADPDLAEDTVLIRAFRDTNVPKFLAEDVPLFMGIIGDLFPGVEIPFVDHGALQVEIEDTMADAGLQVVPAQVGKVIQLFETQTVRHGVMLVGLAGTGKTSVLECLGNALGRLRERLDEDSEDSGSSDADGSDGEQDGGDDQDNNNNNNNTNNDDGDDDGVDSNNDGGDNGNAGNGTRRRNRGARPPADPGYQKVERYFLNPKALTMGELYGQFNEVSHEWTDGLVAKLVRECVAHQESPHKRWIVFDGPVDALWIENMNTVLDDNKTLCLANGERIRLTKQMNMVFEVNDLAVASPATVSRCGMVYLEEVHLGWRAIAKSWAARLGERLDARHGARILELMERVVDPTIKVLRSRCREHVASTNIGVIQGMLNILDSLLLPEYGVGIKGWVDPDAEGKEAGAGGEGDIGEGGEGENATAASAPSSVSATGLAGAGKPLTGGGDGKSGSSDGAGDSDDDGNSSNGNAAGGDDDNDNDGDGDDEVAPAAPAVDIMDEGHIAKMVDLYFIFAYVWGLGGNVADPASCAVFSDHAIDHIRAIRPDFPATIGGASASSDVFAYFVSWDSQSFLPWTELCPPAEVDPATPYFHILVPTADNIRFRYLLQAAVTRGHNVLLNGTTGTGKTVSVHSFMHPGPENFTSATLTLSGQTTSSMLQDIIESRLDKRRKNLLGPPPGQTTVLFVDDLNMPSPDTYGSQPPIELLRQLIDKGGFYDRRKLFFKRIVGTQMIAACGPPGGGRTRVTERLTRRFAMLSVPEMGDASLEGVFGAIMDAHVRLMRGPEFEERQALESGRRCVSASVALYQSLRQSMLPTPAKSHYTFNLRDLSKVVQGMVQVRPGSIGGVESLARLWCHECARVFEDRLVDDTDKGWFRSRVGDLLRDQFSLDWEADSFARVLFGDYLTPSDEEVRLYEEIRDPAVLPKLFEDHLEDYNASGASGGQMQLVFFEYAIEHISRVARILRQPRGHALLVGVGGSGRQSVTRLAAHIAGHKMFSIEITKSYGQVEFREDLKKVLMIAGVENRPVCFLFTDTQIVRETFLEDINNILNSGEVPNLFAPEEKEKIVSAVRPLSKRAGAGEARDEVMAHFVHLVRENLHVVLAFSPAGSALRSRCRMYPALINCCTVIWYQEWPESALLSVAKTLFAPIPMQPRLKDEACRVCVNIHASVAAASKQYAREQRRHNYVTPSSYLELIRVYGLLLASQQNALNSKIDRFKSGLTKLKETNAMVGNMQQDLTRLQPTLAKAKVDTEELMTAVQRDQQEADKVREVVMKEETEVAEIARDAQSLADSAKAELDVAMPAYHAAIKALETLNKSDIVEVKSFISPPPLVRVVMDAVCLLLGVKQTWEDAKKLLGDLQFINTLRAYDKDSLTDSLLRKLKRYIENPQFQPEVVQKVSRAATCLCMWVRAIDTYARVYREVQPKKARHAEATARLEAAEAQLNEKRSQLADVDSRVAALRTKYEDSQAKLDELQRMIEETRVRLTRAEQLVDGLAGEAKRWDSSATELENSRGTMDGDMLVCAGVISYLGPFTYEYRSRLMRRWSRDCASRGIRVDPALTLERAMGDPVTIQQWKGMGLPNDAFSVENAFVVTKSRRWPLLVDPQGQANRWLKNVERDAGLAVCKAHDPNFLRTLENAIRVGTPVLLEDVGEQLDPALEPVLLKKTIRRSGRVLIRLGDTEIDYSPDFRFYISTKLPNPHYLPELFVRVTVINFTVTPQGLEDQLLAEVVGVERPDLESQKAELIHRISDGQRRLKETEDAILAMIASATGTSLVDDVTLIETLETSKTTSIDVAKGIAEAKETAVAIDEARERYRAVAQRGSQLYFVLPDLAAVDPMYQYSLSYFVGLFKRRIASMPAAESVEARVAQLIPAITKFVFVNVARGLFEKDKVFFSLGIAIALMRGAGRLGQSEMQFVLRGASVTDESLLPANPCPNLVPAASWPMVTELDSQHEAFSGLVASLKSHGAEWAAFIDATDPVSAAAYGALPGKFGKAGKLTTWQRIMLLRALREEKLVFALRGLIVEELDRSYLEFPPFDLGGAFSDSGPLTPVVFVLSPGADPAAALLSFAKSRGMDRRLHMVSLGQGQGPRAAALIRQASRDGDWVCLQNCHLAASWMPELERIQELAMEAGPSDVHGDYRLWLTSAPSKAFPVPVLQNGIKLTNEPPKGLKANLTRSLGLLDESDFDSPDACAVPNTLRKLTFGLVYFHAIVQERRKYGPIGWNVPYEWNDSDLSVSQRMLKQYAQQASVGIDRRPANGGNSAEDDSGLQYTALTQLIGEIHYGGRVTDRMDLVCAKSIVSLYICPEITRDGYLFPGPGGAHDGAYRAPPTSCTTLEAARAFVAGLPDKESPEVFGLDPNTVITYERKETAALIDTLILVQPRGASTSSSAGKKKGGGGDDGKGDGEAGGDGDDDGEFSDGGGAEGGSEDDKFVLSLVEGFEEKLPAPLDKSRAHPSTFALTSTGAMNSLGVVLAQEIVRFNALLRVIRSTLVELRRAIRGEVVMSETIEAMFGSFLFQNVPSLWTNAAYPSLRALGPWFQDLSRRIATLEAWLVGGPPASFWMPGFFFPQGFLTGVLQTHARKHQIAIDTLAFRCHIVEPDAAHIKTPPKDGVYVHGLFLEGARWDRKKRSLADSAPKEMSVQFPVVHLEPTAGTTRPRAAKRFVGLPIYRTSERRGVLSTTGRSTNFVTTILVNTLDIPDKWIRRGAALICENV